LTSELLEIPGVGAKTAKKLLTQFGSLERLRSLSLEELGQAVRPSQAARIVEHFQGRGGADK
jgi:excinuclease ABC subunit C